MNKMTVVFGACALAFAVADLIHGQHNGDAHRLYIHIVEFVSFFAFLSLLEVHAFRSMADRVGLDRWLAGVFLSLASLLAGFTLFAVAGGSMHGDGGPLASCFFLMYGIATICAPITIVGFLVSMILRKINGSSAS